MFVIFSNNNASKPVVQNVFELKNLEILQMPHNLDVNLRFLGHRGTGKADSSNLAATLKLLIKKKRNEAIKIKILLETL